MRLDLLRLAADLSDRGLPYALAVVVRREPPSSARTGDAAIVTSDGVLHGWVGGSCTKPTVIREAQRALAAGTPRLLILSPSGDEAERPGLVAYPMTCHSGGSVEIYVQPVLPAPRLVVFGASPLTHALERLGAAMGYAVEAVDVGATPNTPPGGSVFAVVATQGEDDESALRAALRLLPAYLGVIASPTRAEHLRESLLAAGASPDAVAGVRGPAGLDIGAAAPEEIALSVLAEIVQLRRAGAPREAPAAAAPVERAAPDPVCGMTVAVRGARYTATYAGTTFYFCCGGCRERFAADPARYAAVGGVT